MSEYFPYVTPYGDWSAPATQALAVTPSDSSDLDFVARFLWIGGAGDVTVLLPGSSTPVEFVGCVAGSVLPIACTRVMEASTATNILACR